MNKKTTEKYVLECDINRCEGNEIMELSLNVLKIGTEVDELVQEYINKGNSLIEQASFIKDKAKQYNVKEIRIDGRGIGTALIDYLVIGNKDYPAYEVINSSRYNDYKTDDSIPMIFDIGQ